MLNIHYEYLLWFVVSPYGRARPRLNVSTSFHIIQSIRHQLHDNTIVICIIPLPKSRADCFIDILVLFVDFQLKKKLRKI